MGEDLAEAYDKYRDELIRFASGVVGPWLAEDVLSCAIGRLSLRAGAAGIEQMRPYLYRCVFNEAVSMKRAADRRIRREREAHVLRAELADPIVSAEVLDAMSRLTVRQRAVVFLTYWSELDARAAAARLGTSPRTIERELAAARRRLEEMLQ